MTGKIVLENGLESGFDLSLDELRILDLEVAAVKRSAARENRQTDYNIADELKYGMLHGGFDELLERWGNSLGECEVLDEELV